MTADIVRTYVRKPAKVVAIKYTGENCREVFEFLGIPFEEHATHDPHVEIEFSTEYDSMTLWPDEYVLMDEQGSYLCLPAHEFETLFELLED